MWTAAGRAEVDLLLKDMEHLELPAPGVPFDFRRSAGNSGSRCAERDTVTTQIHSVGRLAPLPTGTRSEQVIPRIRFAGLVTAGFGAPSAESP